MTPMPLRLFVMKLQPKVGLAGYDILFAYIVVEAKSKIFLFKKTDTFRLLYKCFFVFKIAVIEFSLDFA